MARTKTIARNAKETRWRREIGFWVDTLWALRRSSWLTLGDGNRVVVCLGDRALLVFKDDVLVMCGVKSPSWRGRWVRAGQHGEG
jgi:hypothetical protein